MRLLAIDPGSRVTGWGVIERDAQGGLHLIGYGTLRPPADQPSPQRLAQIHAGVVDLLTAHEPQALAIEEAFLGKNIKSAIRLAEARAVVLLAAVNAGATLFELPPALVKKSVTGHGRASKDTVRDQVMAQLGWDPGARPPAYDASDALAIGLCALRRSEGPVGLLSGRPIGRTRRGGRGGWTQRDIERLTQRGSDA